MFRSLPMFLLVACVEPVYVDRPLIVEREVVRLVEVPKYIETCGRVVRANDEEFFVTAPGRTRDQAIKLARWCVVEDACVLWPEGKGNAKHPTCGTGGKLSPECKAIVEVAEHNRKQSHDTWDDALAFMSPRMMGDEEPRTRRSKWVKGLQADGDAPPPTWLDNREHGNGGDGDWRLYDHRWSVLRDAMALWWLTGPHDVCDGDPLAEGTEADAKKNAIPGRGFVRYECEGVTRLWIGGPPVRVASIQ